MTNVFSFSPFLTRISSNTYPAMATSSTDSLISMIPTPTHLSVVHHLVTIKLTCENYLLWKAQIVPYLRGQHLFGFLDGSRPAPSPYLGLTSDGSSQPQPNPDHHAWLIQDQMILSALISSLSENILAYVVKCTTSRDVWLTLERMFIAHSRARTMTIRYQLSTLKKGDLSIVDYFHTFTGLVDTLVAINQPLTEEEQISFLLAGLGSEYESFITTVHMCTELLSIETLYGHLLSQELHMVQAQPKVDLSLAGAHFASRGGSSSRGIVMVDPLIPIKLDAPLQATVSLVVVGPPQMVLILLVRSVVRLGIWL